MSKANNHLKNLFFPFFSGVRELLQIADAQIVSSEGEVALSNKVMMEKVNDAIKKADTDKQNHKSILVDLE